MTPDRAEERTDQITTECAAEEHEVDFLRAYACENCIAAALRREREEAIEESAQSVENYGSSSSSETLQASVRAIVSHLRSEIDSGKLPGFGQGVRAAATVVEDEGPYGDCQTGCRENYAEAIRLLLDADGGREK